VWVGDRTNMKKVETFCDNCVTEFSVELIDGEAVVKYCPVCGSPLEDEVETIEIDEDFMEQDWED